MLHELPSLFDHHHRDPLPLPRAEGKLVRIALRPRPAVRKEESQPGLPIAA